MGEFKSATRTSTGTPRAMAGGGGACIIWRGTQVVVSLLHIHLPSTKHQRTVASKTARAPRAMRGMASFAHLTKSALATSRTSPHWESRRSERVVNAPNVFRGNTPYSPADRHIDWQQSVPGRCLFLFKRVRVQIHACFNPSFCPSHQYRAEANRPAPASSSAAWPLAQSAL